jgi:hypothetical protein
MRNPAPDAVFHLEQAKVETRGYGNRADAERVVAAARARARG